MQRERNFMKTHHKSHIFWIIVTTLSMLAVGAVFITPTIKFDKLKPALESAIFKNSGLHTKIGGSVRMSLLGGPKMIANNVTISDYNGVIESAILSIPWHEVFNPITFNSTITLIGADFELSELTPPKITNRIMLRDSAAVFMGKRLSDVNGVLLNGNFIGHMRLDNRKYKFTTSDGNFKITNPDVNLEIVGQLFSDQSGEVGASGTMKIETDKINKWFGFEFPVLNNILSANMKFNWTKNKFQFSEISGNTNGAKFIGEITKTDDFESIKLTANNLNYDLSIIMKNPVFLRNSNLDLDISGNLKFGTKTYSRLIFVSRSAQKTFEIQKLHAIGENESFAASGIINDSGANGVQLEMNENGIKTSCEFFGSTDVWRCSKFVIKTKNTNVHGSVSVNPTSYDLVIESENMSLEQIIPELKKRFGNRRGHIKFNLQNGRGSADLTRDIIDNLDFNTDSATLASLHINKSLPLPEQLLNMPGEISVITSNGKLTSLDFIAPSWSFAMADEAFVLEYSDAKELLSFAASESDLFFMESNIPIVISGNFKKPFLRDLEIEIGGNILTGYAENGKFNLTTDKLNLDALVDERFLNPNESDGFLHREPLLAAMALQSGAISLTAQSVVLGDQEYSSFVYSLKPNSQQFSITDTARGNILVSISKNKNNYKMMFQANKFMVDGTLLDKSSTLNISDTVITGVANMETHGITSHDIRYNLSGDIEITLDGGTITGLGIDGFYSQALNITRTNAKDYLAQMLVGGNTALKSLNFIGRYENGIFKTTNLITLGVVHSNITGNMEIQSGRASAILNIILRGTAPDLKPIQLKINQNGTRNYSLDDAIFAIDPEYTREFIATHDKF